ncbi:DUF262 domain-containing protein [Dactylosporangium sp. NPDC048998]|uniref:GmrSD restriction endonuclease domain-containing protein n=1 Tax=Dactylosporangium sp. NPDC048998 TaxID=3363976 RepID=UPI00371A0064
MATLERPRIEQRTPEDLVLDVQRGLVRIPQFQRGFKWDAGDIVKLFDSILRGFPIGNLLLWRRPAKAQTLHVGPLTVEAPELDSALWVVDGQQRITSLVGALSAAHVATDARFRVHLDLDTGEFHTAGARQLAPYTWIPVSFLLDTATLLRWMRENTDWLSDAHLALADQAAKAIREYQIPTYVVTTDDEEPLLDIFTRMNNAGKRLTKAEVFQALHSQTAADEPLTLAAIGRISAELGFGAMDDQLVLRCVLAYRGGDIFRDDFTHEFESPEDRAETFRGLGVALRDVVGFLRDVAEIPHMKLLPYSNVVPVLVRFVRLHGAPEGRAATLLRRWIWRGAVAGTRARGQSVADMRGQIGAVAGPDQVGAASALLKQVPRTADFAAELDKVHFNQAMTKINVLCLCAAEPRDPSTGSPLDLVRLLEDGNPLRPIFDNVAPAPPATLANRAVVTAGPAMLLRRQLATAPAEVAASHLVDEEAQRLLREHSADAFLERRGAALTSAIEAHVDRMAEWGARDGRSVADLLKAV